MRVEADTAKFQRGMSVLDGLRTGCDERRDAELVLQGLNPPVKSTAVFESDNLKLISYVEELSKVKKFFVLNFFFPKYLCKAELIISPHDSEGNGKIEKFKNDNLDCLDEINHQLVGTKRNNFENELPIKKPKYVSPR